MGSRRIGLGYAFACAAWCSGGFILASLIGGGDLRRALPSPPTPCPLAADDGRAQRSDAMAFTAWSLTAEDEAGIAVTFPANAPPRPVFVRNDGPGAVLLIHGRDATESVRQTLPPRCRVGLRCGWLVLRALHAPACGVYRIETERP